MLYMMYTMYMMLAYFYSFVKHYFRGLGMTTEHVDMEVAAQEMAMHISMTVNADYIRSWGVEAFLEKVLEYTDGSDADDITDCLFYLENR